MGWLYAQTYSKFGMALQPKTEQARHGWRKWAWNILISLDQFGNAITAGDPDETISSRAGKAKTQGRRWAVALCWLLDRVDPGHCEESVDETEGGDQVW